MLLWFQHTDFSSEEFREATLETAMEKFTAFDWPGELAKMKQAESKQVEFCDPGIGLVHGDTHILHLCPHSPDIASVFYHYKTPAKVLRLFPYLSSETLHAEQFPLRRIRELFEAHCSQRHAETLKLLQQYPAA